MRTKNGLDILVQREIIQMFNSLCTGIPFNLVRTIEAGTCNFTPFTQTSTLAGRFPMSSAASRGSERSRLMVRVKHRWAQLVLGWVTHTPPGGTGLSDDTEESRSYPRLLRRLYHGGAEWRSSNGVCRVNAHEDLPILMRNNRVELFCFVSCDFFRWSFGFCF